MPSCRIHDAWGVFPQGTTKKFWDDIKKHATEPLQGVFVCPHARAKAAAGSAALFCDSTAFDLREGPHWNPAGWDKSAFVSNRFPEPGPERPGGRQTLAQFINSDNTIRKGQ